MATTALVGANTRYWKRTCYDKGLLSAYSANTLVLENEQHCGKRPNLSALVVIQGYVAADEHPSSLVPPPPTPPSTKRKVPYKGWKVQFVDHAPRVFL